MSDHRGVERRDWTPADIETLAQMWQAGATARAIAAVLGRSRNAVIGMAHRAGCAPRSSPIRPRGSGAPHPARPAAVPGRAAGGPRSGRDQPAGGSCDARQPVVPFRTRGAITRNSEPRTISPGALSDPLWPTRTCQYPMWPDDLPRPPRPALFCGAPSTPGCSWCAAHHAVVWRSGTPSERRAADALLVHAAP